MNDRRHQVLASTDSSAYASVRQRPVSRDERFALGRALRKDVPRRTLARWRAPALRPDPVALIKASHEGRVDELVPVRVARMVGSPYGFLRGSAVVMAWDVARLPATGITPVVCGDAHLGNFGFYGSPEGELVMDLNDFDEAHPGAWEWDLRRLAASIHVAGRENGVGEEACSAAVRNCVLSYRDEVRFLAEQPLLWRSYNRLDVDRLHETVTESTLRTEIDRAVKKARRKTSDRVLPRFTREDEDGRRIVSEPPLITPLGQEEYEQVEASLDEYLLTLQPHWRRAVGGYTVVDIAHKVVGVGSVGLRAYVVLLEGSDPDDVLFLQLKQARRSVLAPFVHGDSVWHDHQGQRVVEYQQALQTVSDPLLGWTTVGDLTCYVRQFRNQKGTVPLDGLDDAALRDYAGIVGHLLAKGHARTSGASMIGGYLGKGERVADSMATFARRYADQTEADHARFVAAVRSGELPIDEEAAASSAFRP
ncbi:uncharacterized protein (DUF2252 family) [Kineosphaera limosa]|uniref:DUF2252 domain-containing protein n=1 Tax=Kineosphaera limosa NBRC 100340 TaxID=1184609 RepID=K6VDC4_9MICO|nr:DUF2252 domain-containing protein [Kineosphaera limosa]NYE02347.1 uncharacterized protein (DUF2252 family) [Kineosphaera limosa]GAB94203.1 hypothetical protein KILIM_003_01260 [Kineosphaera limosa NBRC 100340]